MRRLWMPLYIGDFLADTSHLGATETGIYMRLIMHCWQHGSIPRDDRKLAMIAHCDLRVWHQFRDTVLQFFDAVDASSMQQRRVTKELRRSEEISNKRKAAAMQRHSKRPAKLVQKHTQSQSQSQLQKEDAVSTASSLAAAPSKSMISDQAFEIAKRVLVAMDVEDGDPRGVGAPMTVQGWINGGWDPEIILRTVKLILARGGRPKSLVYFTNAIADAHADLARPLPVGTATGPPPRERRKSFAELAIEMENRINERASTAE